jgi:phospholipid/cholesterol/gamma-HCH transport system permease protein
MNKTFAFFFAFFEAFGEVSLLFSRAVKWAFRKPFDRAGVINQILSTGINSLPVILVTGLFTGMVFSFQTAYSMEARIKGASVLVGSIVGLAIVKELGPVFAAVFVAGRVGSAIAAEIGSMKVTDQIDALTMLSTSPIHYLVVPRLLALIIIQPIVTLFFDFIGIIGGGLVSLFSLNVPLATYQEAFVRAVHFPDFVNGFIKSIFFGAIIAIVACREGLRTVGGAEGVGQATTRAVVTASIAILVSDYFLTVFLAYVFGI